MTATAPTTPAALTPSTGAPEPSTTGSASHPSRGRRPSTLALGLRRARLELKMYFRAKDAVVFNFAFPIMLMVLFGSIFSGTIGNTGVSYKQVLVAGVMAASLMSVSFSNLAIGIAMERTEGTLKRLALLPVSPASYFIGKVGMVLVCALLADALALGLGVAFYGITLPTDPVKWMVFAGVFILGVTACSLIGLAYSRIPRTAKAAAAVVTPPFIALQFISGVWVPYETLPVPLQLLSSAFPLRWIVQGMHAVFLPDSFLAAEPTGTWQLPATFAILTAWVVGGFVLCLLTFRWKNRSDD